MSHTPTPWHWVNSDDDSPYIGEGHPALRTVKEFGKNETIIRDGKSYTSFALPEFILDAEPGLSLADAAFIVQAVNHYERLIKALEYCAAGPGELRPENQAQFLVARAALAACGEK